MSTCEKCGASTQSPAYHICTRLEQRVYALEAEIRALKSQPAAQANICCRICSYPHTTSGLCSACRERGYEDKPAAQENDTMEWKQPAAPYNVPSASAMEPAAQASAESPIQKWNREAGFRDRSGEYDSPVYEATDEISSLRKERDSWKDLHDRARDQCGRALDQTDALRKELAELRAKLAEAQAIFDWLLTDLPPKPEGAGMFYWRTELRLRMSRLTPSKHEEPR